MLVRCFLPESILHLALLCSLPLMFRASSGWTLSISNSENLSLCMILPRIPSDHHACAAGRVLGIPVCSVRPNEPHRLLNYLTSPHVVIWSAVTASCAFPGLFEAQELMAKDRHGRLVPYHMPTEVRALFSKCQRARALTQRLSNSGSPPKRWNSFITCIVLAFAFMHVNILTIFVAPPLFLALAQCGEVHHVLATLCEREILELFMHCGSHAGTSGERKHCSEEKVEGWQPGERPAHERASGVVQCEPLHCVASQPPHCPSAADQGGMPHMGWPLGSQGTQSQSAQCPSSRHASGIPVCGATDGRSRSDRGLSRQRTSLAVKYQFSKWKHILLLMETQQRRTFPFVLCTLSYIVLALRMFPGMCPGSL